LIIKINKKNNKIKILKTMSTINSTLKLFALRSYVSVLTEIEKETTLKIVGGFKPERDLYINRCGDIQDIDKLFEKDCNPGPLSPWSREGADIPVCLKIDNNPDSNTYGLILDVRCSRQGESAPTNYTDQWVGLTEWQHHKEELLKTCEEPRDNDNRDTGDNGRDDERSGDEDNLADLDIYPDIPDNDDDDDVFMGDGDDVFPNGDDVLPDSDEDGDENRLIEEPQELLVYH
jgi:hypothetical protein